MQGVFDDALDELVGVVAFATSPGALGETRLDGVGQSVFAIWRRCSEWFLV